MAEHLDGDETVFAYLETVLEDGDPPLIAAALDDVARAKEFQDNSQLSGGVGLDAVFRILKAMGLNLTGRVACIAISQRELPYTNPKFQLEAL